MDVFFPAVEYWFSQEKKMSFIQSTVFKPTTEISDP